MYPQLQSAVVEWERTVIIKLRSKIIVQIAIVMALYIMKWVQPHGLHQKECGIVPAVTWISVLSVEKATTVEEYGS